MLKESLSKLFSYKQFKEDWAYLKIEDHYCPECLDRKTLKDLAVNRLGMRIILMIVLFFIILKLIGV